MYPGSKNLVRVCILLALCMSLGCETHSPKIPTTTITALSDEDLERLKILADERDYFFISLYADDATEIDEIAQVQRKWQAERERRKADENGEWVQSVTVFLLTQKEKDWTTIEHAFKALQLGYATPEIATMGRDLIDDFRNTAPNDGTCCPGKSIAALWRVIEVIGIYPTNSNLRFLADATTKKFWNVPPEEGRKERLETDPRNNLRILSVPVIGAAPLDEAVDTLGPLANSPREDILESGEEKFTVDQVVARTINSWYKTTRRVRDYLASKAQESTQQ